VNPLVTTALVDEFEKIARKRKPKPPKRLPADFKASLKPGDIILTNAGSRLIYKDKPITGAVQGVLEKLKSVQLGNYGHSLIYVGNGRVVDAHPAYGVREQPIEDALYGVHSMALRPNVSRRMRRKAVARARARVGKTDYSMKEAFRAWGGMHFDMPTRDRRRKITSMMCSGLINDAYMGKLVNKHPDLTVPPDFAKSKKLTRIGGTGVFKYDPKPAIAKFKMRTKSVGRATAKGVKATGSQIKSTVKETGVGVKTTVKGVGLTARDISAAVRGGPKRGRGKDKKPRKRRSRLPKAPVIAAPATTIRPPVATVGTLAPAPALMS